LSAGRWDQKTGASESLLPFCLDVQINVRPEYREEFLRVIKNNAKNSNLVEPLCLQYIYGEDESISNTFHFHEEYTGTDGGRQGFDAHTQTAHFQAWEEFAQQKRDDDDDDGPFARPPAIGMYRTLLLPDDARLDAESPGTTTAVDPIV
jgi:(4S)-4-hydroxy-5-phosphonooxypentane-2,3-dione isomerase